MKTATPGSEAEGLNAALEAALARRVAAGVLDIKCHVDVTGSTRPADFKRALLNVFRKDEAGLVPSVPLSALGSFADLYARLKPS